MNSPSPNFSLSAWQLSLRAHDADLADQLAENTNPYAAASELGLPTPECIVFDSLADFMAAPTLELQPLVDNGITNFYVGARTTKPGLSNVRNETPRKAEDIAEFLRANVAPEHFASYNLRIAEFLAEISVVAILAPDGTIELDISNSPLPELTGGTVTPDFRASNDNPKNRLQYFGKTEEGSWIETPIQPDDNHPTIGIEVRTAIWRAIRAMQTHPGYYEFAIVTHNGLRVPIFADAIVNDGNRNRAFSFPQHWFDN